MAWKKVSPELCEILDRAIAAYPVEKRMMFGCPTYFVNNNMFTGVHGEGIILRLPENQREKILTEFETATRFEPMAGRIMKEYIVIPATIYQHPERLDQWLERAFNFVSALPPKEKKLRKKKK